MERPSNVNSDLPTSVKDIRGHVGGLQEAKFFRPPMFFENFSKPF